LADAVVGERGGARRARRGVGDGLGQAVARARR
jgi:hypothetical protein